MKVTIEMLEKELKDRYDYIGKLDAIYYLKSIYNPSIQECIMAHKLAYNE